MRVGIFGGSFDPPHKGHLAVVEAAVRTAGLDQVLVIPSAGAYKENMTVIASAVDRLNMCRLCFGSEPHCFVSDIEAHRSEWIPTIATVERLKKLQHRNDQLVLIVGAALAVPRLACATLQNTEGSYGSLILGISWVSYVIIGLLTFALGICATLLCIHWQQLRQHGSDSR